MKRCAVSACLAMLMSTFMSGASAQATTFTVATFADPSPGSDMPLFEFDDSASLLSGGWSGTGLTLETLIGDFADVTFTMTDTAVMPGGGGTIEFFDDMSDLLLKIEYGSSSFAIIGFGSSDPAGVITMSGPVIEIGFGMPTVGAEESFSFGFANQIATGSAGDFASTAAFTSSTATVPIPEPVSLMLLAGGAGCVVLRRRQIKNLGGG